MPIRSITSGLSSYLRSLFKSWDNDKLVDSYYDARNYRGIFSGVSASKMSTVMRCFAGEFARRGIYDYV